MRSFRVRAFVSLFLLFCSFSLLVSGLVLYVAPHGRDAYWTDWHLAGMNKDQWLAVHLFTGFSFIVISFWHALKNMPQLLMYFFRKEGGKSVFFSLELAAAVILLIILCAGSVFRPFPFSAILDFGGKMQESWVREDDRAPFPHAELLNLRQLAKKLEVDFMSVEKNALAADINMDPGKTLKENSLAAGMSPAQFYEKIFNSKLKEKGKASGNEGNAKGVGRKTVN
ncbi:MAG: DUF4405 domain-containing protein [Elusimicrobia bacterium]|nr:DUF4405 domain-containing protein [Elusimicrobiota bacterium]